MPIDISRRDFIKRSSVAAGALSLGPAPASLPPPQRPFTATLCFFSKPLPQMDWRRLAQAVKRMGFGGIDLTVRPGGHV